MIFPKGLSTGARIGIIAPASPVEPTNLDLIQQTFNTLGYEVDFGLSCFEKYKEYLAGPDAVRSHDIHTMFLDPGIDGIICLRGGYGTPRILNSLDYTLIKNNPKFFVGFSDITALHLAFNQKADLITFHGIMASSAPDWDDFTYSSLLQALNMEKQLSLLNPTDQPLHTLVGGNTEGIITGGNLSLITATLGTDYAMDVKNKILFIEETGEKLYRIDRMLTHLDLAGIFADCRGVIFGDFDDCAKEQEEEYELQDLLAEKIAKYQKPCIYNLQSGHCNPMITIPLGVTCRLDATCQQITLVR